MMINTARLTIFKNAASKTSLLNLSVTKVHFVWQHASHQTRQYVLKRLFDAPQHANLALIHFIPVRLNLLRSKWLSAALSHLGHSRSWS